MLAFYPADHIFWTITAYVFTVIGFLFAVVLIAHLLSQKKTPTAAMAWILAIVLIPHIGVPLYIILGGRKMKRKESLKDNLNFTGRVMKFKDPEVRRITHLLRSFDMPAPAKGHRLKLCHTGIEAYNGLMELIDSAQKTIDIATYVFQHDDVGMAVLSRLTEKVKSGVRVRLLIDDIGAHMLKRRHIKQYLAAGGQFSRFMPLLHIHRRADLRNHRKITLVDNRVVMAGGMNIGMEYMGPQKIEDRWKDLSFILEGPCVNVYAEIFVQDWMFATGKYTQEHERWPDQPIFEEDGIAQIIPSGPDIEGDVLYNAIITAIYSAEKRVYVVTPYFVPDDSLQMAFNLAAHRGVDVQIFIPEVSNQRLANWARGTYLRELQASGVKINLYQPGMMHAKVMLIDTDIAMVGSANIDYRSLQLNYEVAMMTYSREEIAKVERWVMNLLPDCKTGVEPKVKMLRDLGEGVARLVAPLL